MLRKLFKKDEPGFYQGKHYTEYAEQVKALKRKDKLADVEKLLIGLVTAVEVESMSEGLSKAPWYTEQLAIVYRKQQRYADEIAILERFDRGSKKPFFADRIAKAKALAKKG